MSKPRVVIIEDDETLVKIISDMLGKKYEVSIISTDKGSLNKIAKINPSLILLDVLLPGKNGFDFLKDLKSNMSTKNIPVIILSNLGLDEEIRQGISMGAVEYIVKADNSIDKIVEKINKIFKTNN